LTNKQIGERLYLSPGTVATHLHQLFPKLGVTTRAALAMRSPTSRPNSRSAAADHPGSTSSDRSEPRRRLPSVTDIPQPFTRVKRRPA
jgi:hypothetical protein